MVDYLKIIDIYGHFLMDENKWIGWHRSPLSIKQYKHILITDILSRHVVASSFSSLPTNTSVLSLLVLSLLNYFDSITLANYI